MAADICRPVASTTPPVVRVQQQPLAADEARLVFIGHSTFVLGSARGVTIETDYNDYVRSGMTPTVATMNRAHSTHYSHAPDPGIRHVLPGWNPSGEGPIRHDLQVDDVSIRNVTTNIRDWGGGTRADGNSIFLFQVGQLCFAHLGHLHHTLQREHLAEIGRVDVLLVPVDGSFTLDLEGLKEVLGILGASVMVPMHFFSPSTLDRFLDRVRGTFPIREHDGPAIVFTKATLPREPTVIVMPGLHPRYDWRGRR